MIGNKDNDNASKSITPTRDPAGKKIVLSSTSLERKKKR